MNISPEFAPIPTISEPHDDGDMEQAATWGAVGLCAIFVMCFLVWACQFAPDAVAFLVVMAGLA